MGKRAPITWPVMVALLALTCWLVLPARAIQAQERQGEAAAPQALEIVTQEGVEYMRVDDQPLKLELARPKAPGKYPGVICIHGGGWRGGDKASLIPLTRRLAKEGFVAVTVQYRFAPKDPFPAQVDDVRCAVRWLRANAEELQLDPERIGAIGFSAGGHLSLMLGLMEDDDRPADNGCHSGHSSKVQAVVNYFGPTDLARSFPQQVRAILNDFVGGTPEDKAEVVKAASPITYIDRNDAPILTFHGTKDQIVPFEQAELLNQACKKAGLEHRLETQQDANHGWGGEQLVKTLDQSIAFFREHLQQPAKAQGQ